MIQLNPGDKATHPIYGQCTVSTMLDPTRAYVQLRNGTRLAVSLSSLKKTSLKKPSKISTRSRG